MRVECMVWYWNYNSPTFFSRIAKLKGISTLPNPPGAALEVVEEEDEEGEEGVDSIKATPEKSKSPKPSPSPKPAPKPAGGQAAAPVPADPDEKFIDYRGDNNFGYFIP